MNREYLNIIVVDDDEGNLIFFRNICKDLKIKIKIQTFCNGNALMEYLSSGDAVVPEVLLMNYSVPFKSSLQCIEEIKLDFRYNNMVNAIYADDLSDTEIEDVFVKGANIFMKKPGNYVELRKVFSEVIIMTWQYHTSGLNKNNFIMKVLS